MSGPRACVQVALGRPEPRREFVRLASPERWNKTLLCPPSKLPIQSSLIPALLHARWLHSSVNFFRLCSSIPLKSLSLHRVKESYMACSLSSSPFLWCNFATCSETYLASWPYLLSTFQYNFYNSSPQPPFLSSFPNSHPVKQSRHDSFPFPSTIYASPSYPPRRTQLFLRFSDHRPQIFFVFQSQPPSNRPVTRPLSVLIPTIYDTLMYVQQEINHPTSKRVEMYDKHALLGPSQACNATRPSYDLRNPRWSLPKMWYWWDKPALRDVG